MRIAVSGTHFIGKSTFIEDFIKSHADYGHEAEAYHQLQEDHGAEFSEEPTLDDLLEQLDYSMQCLSHYAPDSNVIFDRCPVDYIAYAMYISDREHIDINDSSIADMFPEVKNSLKNIDLIVFLPITKEHEIEYTDYEDAAYRKAIDRCFKKIYRDEVCDIFPGFQQPRIIEIWGNRLDRVKKLESYL